MPALVWSSTLRPRFPGWQSRHISKGSRANGGEFARLEERDWAVIRPFLEENERLFGIPVARLLEVDGSPVPPAQVYRKIQPRAIAALQAEEAWVKMHA